jgi:hypothetical protein
LVEEVNPMILVNDSKDVSLVSVNRNSTPIEDKYEKESIANSIKAAI